GRCKYVHVSSVAPSMALTPLRNPPARPRTISVRVHHGKEREDQKPKRVAPLGIHAWRGSTGRHRKLSGVGRCGAAGPLAPWMAPSSPHGWVNGVSCSPAPPHQTHRNPEPLLLLQLPLLPAGAGRQALQKSTTRSPSPRSPAGPAPPATAAASATPGSSHPAGPATAATPAAGPLRCNRERPRAARH